MPSLFKFSILFLFLLGTQLVLAYPIDGYQETGIRRLLYIQRIMSGEIKGVQPISGATRSICDIKLNLLGRRGDSLATLPSPDPGLQQAINGLFPGLDKSYAIAVMDITPGKKLRFAKKQETRGFQPGSVGKLTILLGLFTELQKIYPDSFHLRQKLLKEHCVLSGVWGMPNEHTVPFFDPKTGKFFKRTIQEADEFSLYEWTDHMISVSSNGAASIVWREAIMMHAFGSRYPVSTNDQKEFWAKTPKSELSKMAMAVVNEPLRKIGIAEDEWRLGSLFTRGAKNIIPGEGGSIGSPLGLMKFLVAMERGILVDEASSLEMKRLMYQTDKRIRYAAAKVLTNAAVYFKSGSLYKCKKNGGEKCGKYMGNVENYMNSVIIVEQPDSTVYLVTLMSNVLRKNSANDHFGLATSIDRIIRK